MVLETHFVLNKVHRRLEIKQQETKKEQSEHKNGRHTANIWTTLAVHTHACKNYNKTKTTTYSLTQNK